MESQVIQVLVEFKDIVVLVVYPVTLEYQVTLEEVDIVDLKVLKELLVIVDLHQLPVIPVIQD